MRADAGWRKTGSVREGVLGRVVADGEEWWHSEQNVVNPGEARKMVARSAIQVGSRHQVQSSSSETHPFL